MATVLRPNSPFNGVTATDRLTRSKKLMMTPTPKSTAMRHRRLVHKDGDSEVKGVRWFAGSKSHWDAVSRAWQTSPLSSAPQFADSNQTCVGWSRRLLDFRPYFLSV